MYGKTGVDHEAGASKPVPALSIKFGPAVLTVLESHRGKQKCKSLFLYIRFLEM